MARKKNALIQRIGASVWLNEAVAALLAGYIRFCHATTRWERDGFEEMNGVLKSGQPVIMVLWHERLVFSTYLLDPRLCPICAITTNSPIAYFGKLLLRRFRYESVMIEPKENPIALTREILRRIKKGYSVAISPDGTRGPARHAKEFPVVWSRSSRSPIFCATYSVRRALRLPTWDRALIPVPFNRGAMIARRLSDDIPRDLSPEESERLRQLVSKELNELTDEADRRAGRPLEAFWRDD